MPQNPFPPVAVVGRGCVLPGALSPDALWRTVAEGQVHLGPAPEGRWRLPLDRVLGQPGTPEPDRAWNDVGGYVEGFEELFDPAGLGVSEQELKPLDPSFSWVLHTAREALREAGFAQTAPGTGLVLGTLSFPSAGMASYAEHIWRGTDGPRPAALNRFNSAQPALLAARALSLDAGAFALDAACASALYAIKLACDRLHDRTADVMLAGAVNCADDLFIHMGFSALSALSRTGRSRPFHPEADGLVPAEGAVVVALMRLEDAVTRALPVLGVIRGAGIANDGRGSGLLVPSEEGQARAMRLAYTGSGLPPHSVSLLECHATGTPVGDAAEQRSTGEVFAAAKDLPIGSAKGNFGHLITAAGGAGLLKVLGAMQAGVRPPSPQAGQEPVEAPLRVLREAEEWTGTRRAAVSAFGFGGNNAHLIVDDWAHGPDELHRAYGRKRARTPKPRRRTQVAVVAVGARVGDGDGRADLTTALLGGPARASVGPRASVEVRLDGLRFPPKDLETAHAQQLLLLEAAREATGGVRLPRERTMVLAGMGCDPQVARYGARWRSAAGEGDAFCAPLDSSGVLGTMANITANRINAQLDLAGASFAVHAEEASGLTGMRLAARAIRAGEADAAVVGAVDLSHEPVHLAALAELGMARPPGDAAVVLVLKSLALARRDGDTVLALIDDAGSGESAGLVVGDMTDDAHVGSTPGAAHFDPASAFGSAHAASGLLSAAIAVLAVHHRMRPTSAGPALPWLAGTRAAEVTTLVLGGGTASLTVRSADSRGVLAQAPPHLRLYTGADRAAVIDALHSGSGPCGPDAGPARLAVLADDGAELAQRTQAAEQWLRGRADRPEGVAFRDRPLGGETAFVFTGGAAAYLGMGRELTLAAPRLIDRLAERAGPLHRTVGWVYDADPKPDRVISQIWGTSYLCQLHALLTRGVLGLHPQATIGYSSGETNALLAMGAWPDMTSLVTDTHSSPLLTEELVGSFGAVRRVWERAGIEGTRWVGHLVGAGEAAVRKASADEMAVHVMAVNSPESCTIGGEPSACERVLARLNPEYSIPLGYDVAAHAPVVGEVGEAWRALHLRRTEPVPGVRFYTCGSRTSYTVTADAAADAITEQAVGTLDFAGTIERAYADGVRVFIEHGPKSLCTDWIRQILGDRAHLAVALDAPDRRDIRHLLRTVAELAVAGLAPDTDALHDLLAAASPAPLGAAAGSTHPPVGARVLTYPAHPAPVRLPVTRAEPASPALGPVQHEAAHSVRDEAAAPVRNDPVAPAEIAELTPVPAPGWRTEPGPIDARALPFVSPAVRQPHLDRLGHVPALAAHHHSVTSIHAEFLAQQDRMHREFMAVRARGLALLLQAAIPPSPRHAPVPPSAPVRPLPHRPAPARPLFDRATLERLASGRISEVFGPQFEDQDGYARQTRMPEPPMLLADRVMSIDAAPASMRTGTIRTETDVRADGWYLDPAGRMPPGVMIEAGQADLLLISWLGIDLLNRGERVYRLLGCTLIYHDSPPLPGETLRFEITIDGHAEQDGIRLFFFHYDCRDATGKLRLSVRDGQAGFFTDAELTDSKGVLWAPAELPAPQTPAVPAALDCSKSAFGPDEVRAFAEGRSADCFGAGWERTRAHVRTPRIPDGQLLLLHDVVSFDARGGPHGRGYLRAELPLQPDSWFFAGHFKNDPCMPGTLMFDGCLQAISFLLTALGHTIERDGWRFEPVTGRAYPMRCRGQATPQSKLLVYEVFVTEVADGPQPSVTADVLCTVDGVKAFHAQGVGVRLVPDWPLSVWRELGAHAEQPTGELVSMDRLGGLAGYADPGPVAEAGGHRYGYASLLACAWGRPTEAFGPSYAVFDGPRRIPRLPGPPYHFMSRIVSVSGPLAGMEPGSSVVAEYDVPDEVWYWEQNGCRMMPFAVLLEVVLQPCGWLAMYTGRTPHTESDLLFRNLDGAGTIHAEVPPGTRVLRTAVELLDVSQTGDMIIESFAVRCRADGREVFTLTTVFGFFPPSAFADQVGLPPSEEERARLALPGGQVVDLRQRPARYCAGELRLPGPMLLMIDRVTGHWPEGGAAGLGRLVADKTVDPGEWFFRAHFFQDPVQPGSLGLEAMVQLLQFHIIATGLAGHVPEPRFEALMTGREVAWGYRGQVVPADALVTVEMEITQTGEDERGVYAVAEAWLWVDGRRIYHARELGVRVVPGASAPDAGSAQTVVRQELQGGPPAPELLDREPLDSELLDPDRDTWLRDHCPTWTVPALPMMSTLDRLAGAVEAKAGVVATGVRDLTLWRWLPVPGPVRVWAEVGQGQGQDVWQAELFFTDAPCAGAPAQSGSGSKRAGPAGPRTTVGGGLVLTGPAPQPPALWAPLQDAEPVALPYDRGSLFHGPAFRLLTSQRIGPAGASGTLDAGAGAVPYGSLHQGLLDAATHVIPHDDLRQWSDRIGGDVAGYPHRIARADFFRPLPRQGEVRVEARFAGFEGDRFPVVELQLSADGELLAAVRLVEVLLPKGPLGSADPLDRADFLRGKRAVPSAGLTEFDGEVTRLTSRSVDESDWLPGTVTQVYGLPNGTEHRLARIAVAEHVGRLAGVHPREVLPAGDLHSARLRDGTGRTYRVRVVGDDSCVSVTGTPAGTPAPALPASADTP
ncbi:beta-ketoacyl synthase N-terminal-like domain-containing protein [Streptomyces sp. MNP-20]|uniref:beta-ketoacyl synthase N-terminal-like domain-containing protein n=1 Tax=Streptomyces sp. MNP-20 TaxID=2721165 RepID=UPI0028167787|nr:beta-ketoacyl synthase N-terminal-like domain-containing protein [Streptomyces sp. MNP-20]